MLLSPICPNAIEQVVLVLYVHNASSWNEDFNEFTNKVVKFEQPTPACTVMVISFRTGRSGQTVQTQIRVFGQVGLGK